MSRIAARTIATQRRKVRRGGGWYRREGSVRTPTRRTREMAAPPIRNGVQANGAIICNLTYDNHS